MFKWIRGFMSGLSVSAMLVMAFIIAVAVNMLKDDQKRLERRSNLDYLKED